MFPLRDPKWALAIKQVKTAIGFPKMTDKKPHRYIVPVECTQPIAKPYPWESINTFSPEREFGVKTPEPKQPRRRHQPSSRTSHKRVNEENIPPPGPSTQSYCTTYNMSTLYRNRLKVSFDYFCSNLYWWKTLACPVWISHRKWYRIRKSGQKATFFEW